MRPVILRLDDALERQTALEGRVLDAGGEIAIADDLGPAFRLWTRSATREALKARLGQQLPGRMGGDLVFAGSGDFHHVTPLLIERAAQDCGGPVTILHFDNHPDWARFARGKHCGSWVGEAARMCGVEKVVTVGVCSPDIGHAKAREGDLELITENRLELYAWAAPDGSCELELQGRAWPTVQGLGEEAFLRRLEGTVTTRCVYVTIDKDVLCRGEAVTNWDQGLASLDFVIEAIRRVCAGRRLVGADVVGDWSEPVYGGGPAAWVLKQGEALLDQPWRRPLPEAADAVNEAANLRLLGAFREIAA